jgi:hypothetical protein
MPQLRRKKWKCISHPYYVRYVNNHPVAMHGPAEVLKFECYSYATQQGVDIATIRQE